MKRTCTACNAQTHGITTPDGVLCPDCYQKKQEKEAEPYVFADSKPTEYPNDFEEHEAREVHFFGDTEFNRRLNAKLKGWK